MVLASLLVVALNRGRVLCWSFEVAVDWGFVTGVLQVGGGRMVWG